MFFVKRFYESFIPCVSAAMCCNMLWFSDVCAAIGVLQPGDSFTYDVAGDMTMDAKYAQNVTCSIGENSHIARAEYIFVQYGSLVSNVCEYYCEDGYSRNGGTDSKTTSFQVGGLTVPEDGVIPVQETCKARTFNVKFDCGEGARIVGTNSQTKTVAVNFGDNLVFADVGICEKDGQMFYGWRGNVAEFGDALYMPKNYLVYNVAVDVQFTAKMADPTVCAPGANVARGELVYEAISDRVGWGCKYYCKEGYSRNGGDDPYGSFSRAIEGSVESWMGTTIASMESCQARTFAVKFNCGENATLGDTQNSSEDVKVKYGEEFIIPERMYCTKEGFYFEGWEMEQN